MSRSLSCIAASLIVLASFLGCDNGSSPNIEEQQQEKAEPLKINSLSSDSLYWGEWVSVNGSGFGTDSSALKLFLYFSELKFSLMTSKTIFFQVPENSETGKLRLYRGDSLAEGTLTLHVLPKKIDGFSPSATQVQPKIADLGDMFAIHGYNLPMRARDISIVLNGMPMPIDSFTTERVYSHVPDEATSGEMLVTLMGRTFPMGSFTVAK